MTDPAPDRGRHPITLAAWLTVLLVLGIAETAPAPTALTLLLHLPALMLPALLFAYTAPPRLRHAVLLLSAPLAAVELAMLGA